MLNHFKRLFWRLKIKIKELANTIKSPKGTSSQNEIIPSKSTFDKKQVSSLHSMKLPTFAQFKHLGKSLPEQELKTVKLLSIVVAVSVIFIGARFYFTNFKEVPVQGGKYVEGLIGAPQFINPLLSQTNDVDTDIESLIFSGLMRYDKNLELVPDIAQGYKVSEDQKTYVFEIKQDILWHDGENLTVDDIIFTYHSAQDPDFKSPLSFSLRGIDIEITGEYQITFTLSESYAPFLEVLTVGIIPEHIWGEIPSINANLTEYNIKPIGTGQWQFENLIKDKLGNIKSYTLVPHPEYYGQKPYLDEITFKFYPEFETGVDALNNKNIEGISFLPKGLEDRLRTKKAQLYSFYLPQYTAIFFNQKNNEILKNSAIRRALALSIDRTKILTEALRLKGDIIDGPLLPGFIGYNPDLEKIPYNPSIAIDTIEKAGWKKINPEEYLEFLREQNEEDTVDDVEEDIIPVVSADGESKVEISTATNTESLFDEFQEEDLQDFYLKSGDTIFEITLTTVDLPQHVKAAEIIKEFWQAIGVKVNLQITDDARISREIIKPRDYDALLFGVIVGADPDPYPFWHSSQIQSPGLNLANYANRKVDKLLEDARTTSDIDKRAEAYQQFQIIISSDIPAIFLYNPTYTYLVNKKIQGIDIERVILPRDRFNNITEWYVKTGRRWKG